MEESRKKLTDGGIDRVFTPGRLTRQWMAMAYEKLVPIPRFSRCQEPQQSRPEFKEEYRWAQ